LYLEPRKKEERRKKGRKEGRKVFEGYNRKKKKKRKKGRRRGVQESQHQLYWCPLIFLFLLQAHCPFQVWHYRQKFLDEGPGLMKLSGILS